MSSDRQLFALSKRVGEALQERGLKLVLAESCTGGWLAKCVTDVPGSSAWFDRGFVVYSNAAKMELLGVSDGTLSHFGAVSREVAFEMASGALAHSHADIAVSTTGIAGPTGGTPEKPVGTVWIGWFWEEKGFSANRFHFEGDREAVRREAVAAALSGLLRLLEA